MVSKIEDYSFSVSRDMNEDPKVKLTVTWALGLPKWTQRT